MADPVFDSSDERIRHGRGAMASGSTTMLAIHEFNYFLPGKLLNQLLLRVGARDRELGQNLMFETQSLNGSPPQRSPKTGQ